MRDFEELLAEAAAADVTGWDFSWLDGRATEERPPWGYARLLAGRLAGAKAAVDLDTGGGEIVAEAERLPDRMCVTESWAPNARRARELLGPRGVEIFQTEPGKPLPFPDRSFDLVTSRHPVSPQWNEIARVLEVGGRYFAQHVGPLSVRSLSEFFLGPLPGTTDGRDPAYESEQARAAGLTITDLRTARCRVEFFDVGAVIYILRKCVWWVPDFSVERYGDRLLAMHEQIERDGAFVTYSTRHLIEARR